jgi:5-methylcytosine-specific restriction endonuclease McrA
MSGGERIPRAVGPCPYWLAQGQWEEVKLEHRTQYNIQVLCEKIAAIAAPVWRFGDCHGGAVMMQLADACARAGLYGRDSYQSVPSRMQTLADRDGWICAYCGCPLGWGHESVQPPEVEHRIPKSRGGSNLLENLCLSCGPCNSKKGTKTDVEFLEEVPF